MSPNQSIRGGHVPTVPLEWTPMLPANWFRRFGLSASWQVTKWSELNACILSQNFVTVRKKRKEKAIYVYWRIKNTSCGLSPCCTKEPWPNQNEVAISRIHNSRERQQYTNYTALDISILMKLRKNSESLIFDQLDVSDSYGMLSVYWLDLFAHWFTFWNNCIGSVQELV